MQAVQSQPPQRAGRAIRTAGKEGVPNMAKVIEYYVPSSYKKKTRWVPESLRGKVIDFPADLKKPA